MATSLSYVLYWFFQQVIQLQYDTNRDLNKQKNLTTHDQQSNLYGFVRVSHKHIGKKLFEDLKNEKGQVNWTHTVP